MINYMIIINLLLLKSKLQTFKELTMTKNKKRKELLFNIYSQNLLWVKKHLNLSFKPDFEEGYICPLCFGLFPRKALDEKYENSLTYDHNPPQSLKGKNGVLTCKNCNSKTGHTIDNQLLTRLEEIDFGSFKPKSKKRVTLNKNGNKITSDFEIEDNGEIRININRKNTNPIEVDNFLASTTFLKEIKSPLSNSEDFCRVESKWELNFKIQLPIKSNERFAEIALLKIAYLYAFQKFGYGFIINPYLTKVREQILNPEKEILPKVFWIKYEFPEELVGLNIINKPKDLFCYLIIFYVETKSQKKQFAIALPGFSEPYLELYANIESILCGEESITEINIEHIKDREYSKEENFSFASQLFWKYLVCS